MSRTLLFDCEDGMMQLTSRSTPHAKRVPSWASWQKVALVRIPPRGRPSEVCLWILWLVRLVVVQPTNLHLALGQFK